MKNQKCTECVNFALAGTESGDAYLFCMEDPNKDLTICDEYPGTAVSSLKEFDQKYAGGCDDYERLDGGFSVESETKIINLKSGDAYDIYIGRQNNSLRYGSLRESFFENPFRLLKDGPGPVVLKKYREHIIKKKGWKEELEKLRGKILACWCKPGPCHGDVLIELLEENKD